MADIPARLHVLLASESSQAIVIRRGPSQHCAVIGWDRSNDKFTLGQWLKGRIYPFRSDISPDGRHWIYFAMGAKYGRTWTAVAKTAYLKALDFYPKRDAWNGGGLFSSSSSYCLNDGPYPHERKQMTSGLGMESYSVTQGECPLIYFKRLERDGWEMLSTEQADKYSFKKDISSHWALIKHFTIDAGHPEGRGVYYDTHSLHSSDGDIPMPSWEWADIDAGRILWAENGQIWAGTLSQDGFNTKTMLFDSNSMIFEERTAPY